MTKSANPENEIYSNYSTPPCFQVAYVQAHALHGMDLSRAAEGLGYSNQVSRQRESMFQRF